MFMICGLGNPGREYEGTRHNVGFAVIDVLRERYRMDGGSRFGRSMVYKGFIEGNKVLLIKPLTYMNLSGEAVREIVDYYKADPASELVVISDDIDLEEGQLRIRKKGSAGGHNGLKNIVKQLGSDAFMRIRIGVGAKPGPDYDLADYVLGRPRGEAESRIREAEEQAADAAALILQEGADAAMNRFNSRKNKKDISIV
ncbi:aminoacyl-tRNA hydrolase [Lachnoclostridium sp. Marseille-P6806]|uniref:aminoacyl-tRNA hydrolase n=1 Tax=Lachnoclostridium sp. Marseille-P6806 TaxID=2364793 RepID=UPI00102FB572|nr:aminoacyl-tRNA hydrolase [Lachnoclostridium sp. Marseille-P6806]